MIPIADGIRSPTFVNLIHQGRICLLFDITCKNVEFHLFLKGYYKMSQIVQLTFVTVALLKRKW